MTTDFFKRVWAFVLFCLLQALILNHIHLLGYATPLLFVDFVLSFKRGTARWAILLWCFALGLCIDIFSNTPGVASGSMTLMGLLQPYLLEPFVPRDSADDLVPSMRTLGVSKFITYALIMVVIFTIVFFALEAFCFYNWQQWLITVGSSIALTFVLILVIENIWNK